MRLHGGCCVGPIYAYAVESHRIGSAFTVLDFMYLQAGRQMQATIPTCKLPNAMHCFGTVLLTTNRDERRRKKTGPKTRLQLGLASDDETSKQNACTGNIQHNHSPLPNGTARHCMACYGLLLMSHERVVYSGGFIVLLPPLICCMVNFIYSTFEAQKITNTALP